MKNTEKKSLENSNPTKSKLNKYLQSAVWITLVLFINVATIYLYDKYVSLHIKTIDMQKIIQDPNMMKKFMNKKINENQYAINLQTNLEKLEDSLKRYLIKEPNTLFLIKGAVIDLKGFKSNKIVDITNEVYRDIQTHTHK